MFVATVVFITSFMPTNPGAVGAKEFESPDAYELVAPVAISVLPEPLRGHLDSRVAEIAAVAGQIVGDEAREGSPHLVPCWLPDGTNNPPDDARIDEILFSAVPAHDAAGTLPNELLAHYRALVDAFRFGNIAAVVREVGKIVHFATDAALPFHESRDWASHRSGPVAVGDEAGRWRGALSLRDRFHVLTIKEMRHRWLFEFRVAGDRFVEIDDPAAAIRRSIVDALWAREALSQIFFKLMWLSNDADRTRLSVESPRFNAELARRAGPLVRGRLEEGALLAAGFIHGAWMEAGKPDLSRWTAESGRGERRREGTEKPAAAIQGASFVGSKSSETFHRRACQHVERIKPENLVSFSTTGEAEKAGRKPCKTCKPDQAMPAKP